MSKQTPTTKKRPPREELQYEALEVMGYAPTLLEQMLQKTAAEDRDISYFARFFPFGCEVRVPAWIKSGWKTMYSKRLPCRAYIEGAAEPNVAIMVTAEGKHTLGRVLWMYESLINCALFWRWQEGFAVRDRARKIIWPRIDDDGFPVVDEWERDDGGVSVLRAVDLPLTVCSYEEVRDFCRALGRSKQYAWTRWKGKNSYSMFGGLLGIYMTGEPQLEQINLPPPALGRTPNTSHGSAQWAEGVGAQTWLAGRG